MSGEHYYMKIPPYSLDGNIHGINLLTYRNYSFKCKRLHNVNLKLKTMKTACAPVTELHTV